MPPKKNRKRSITVDQLLAAQSGESLSATSDATVAAAVESGGDAKPKQVRKPRKTKKSAAATAEGGDVDAAEGSTAAKATASIVPDGVTAEAVLEMMEAEANNGTDVFAGEEGSAVEAALAAEEALADAASSKAAEKKKRGRKPLAKHEPLAPTAIGLGDSGLLGDASSADDAQLIDHSMAVMARHVVTNTMVGREVPAYTNRAFIMPVCYVPRGSDTLEEVESRNGGGAVSNAAAAVGDDGTPALIDYQGQASTAVPPSSSSSAFAVEEGTQFDTLNAFLCPFMVHQRVAMQGFVDAKLLMTGGGAAAAEEDVLEEVPVVAHQPSSSVSVSSAAASLPSFERTPAMVMRSVMERARAMAKEHSLPLSSVHPSTTTFAVEQTLMRYRARTALDAPPQKDEFMYVDCDVRLGVAAVFPKTIAQATAYDLTKRQHAYVSRFQLLEEGGENATASTIGTSTPPPGTAAADIHIASDLVVGAFDPYFTTPTFQGIQSTLKRLSASKIDKAAEAVQLRSKIPIYQLTFQSRTEAEGVLVLESHDNGATWVEVKSQEGLGAITTPIVNTRKMAMEAVFTAKHIRKCSQVECEWASYYLKHTFMGEDAKKEGSAEAAAARAGGKAAADLSGVGYVHPQSTDALGARLEALRLQWQLVSIERTTVQAAQCSESSKLMSPLASTVAVDEMARDLAPVALEHAEKTVRGHCTEASLILWLWQHTKTLFADDGVSFLRGATTFRRRVSLSNEHMLRERAALWSGNPLQSLNRYATALQTVLNESSTVLSLKFPDLVFTHDKGYKSLAGDLPLYVFATDNAKGIPQRVVASPSKKVLGDLLLEEQTAADAEEKALPEANAAETAAAAVEAPAEAALPADASAAAAEGAVPASEAAPAAADALAAEGTATPAEVAAPMEATPAEVDASPAAAVDAPQKEEAAVKPPAVVVSTQSRISVAEHGAFLQSVSKVPLPVAELAKSFAFHAYIPWGTVHYPLSLNTFTDVRLPVNLSATPAAAAPVAAAAEGGGDAEGSAEGEATSSAVTTAADDALACLQGDVPTFVLRRNGKLGILKSTSSSRNAIAAAPEEGEVGPESEGTDPAATEEGSSSANANVSEPSNGDVVFEARDATPLAFDKASMTAEAEAAVADGMRALFSSSFKDGNGAKDLGGDYAATAPVFSVSFGHSDWAAFDCQGVLSDVLVRMLGKSVKTTVSALCFSDHPSSAVRGLRPETAAVVNSNYTPLGTRSVTSVFLDSKDASRSQVTNIGKLFKSPESQEYGVRTLLRRMLAPTSLQQARVLVQSVAPTEEGKEGRELVPEGTEEPSLDAQPYMYEVSVLPEEALDLFRPVAYATVDQSDASSLSKLSARLSAVEALFSQASSATSGGGQEALKEMIRTSVSVSQVILENSRATSIAQLLESKVKGESTFGYLPQMLEASNLRDGAESTLGDGDRASTKLRSLLHRDLSRVVFAEDKYFVSEGVQGTRNRTEPIPTTHVVHRTLHDVSVGSDGIARYEKVNFVFFTLRDPNVITGARGKADRVQEMLSTAARADAAAGKPELVPNSATSRDVPLISDVFSLLQNFGRWGVDKQFAAKTTRDALQLEGRTASGASVHHVLQGWLQSALSQQSADVLAMVQGDEQLARNPLVHILIDAANKCSNQIQRQCRGELLHWVSGLAEVAAIMSPRELEHAYLTMDMKRVFRKSGIPSDLLPHIFHPRIEEESSSDGGSGIKDPFLRVLPCDTHCKLTPRLLVDFGVSSVVPVTIPKTLHTSDGMPVPEGSVAFVGHATPDLITKCNNYFGEMAPIHQLGDLLVIPTTQDIDASLAVELCLPQDAMWKSSLETQYARMKTLQGQGVLMKRYRHNQFVPPTVLERSFVQHGNRYAMPPIGAPLYKKGKLVTFNKGTGAHEFVSRVLQSANLRKIVSFITK